MRELASVPFLKDWKQSYLFQSKSFFLQITSPAGGVHQGGEIAVSLGYQEGVLFFFSPSKKKKKVECFYRDFKGSFKDVYISDNLNIVSSKMRDFIWGQAS